MSDVNAMTRILVIEDQDSMRDAVCMTLQAAGYDVRAFAEPKPALAALARETFQCLVTDLKLPGMDGVQVLEEALRTSPDLPVILMTAHGTIENAVEAMKKGAYDYLTKPFQPDALDVAVARAIRHHALVTENEILRAQREDEGELVPGEGPRMKEVVQQVRRIAGTDSTVLISGESGTGKEVFARAIHAWSPRKSKPFLAVNCAALSAGLLESELFGHEKGAFTGADRTRKGRFELADGGTILLDEVSEIDLNLQAKLLRVLQERCFERVGSSASQKVDVRVIATTNRDLQKAIRDGKFREDLFFRLNVLPLRLPPLRERREDVEPLVKHLVARIARRLGRPIPPVPDRTLAVRRAYDWPGNVRELANVLERGIVLMQGDALEASDMQAWVEPRAAAAAPAPEGGGALPRMTLEELERRAIEEALARFGGSRLKTAQSLGISDRTLRDKLRRWKLAKETTD